MRRSSRSSWRRGTPRVAKLMKRTRLMFLLLIQSTTKSMKIRRHILVHQKNSKPEMVTIVKREAVSNTEKEERTKEVANKSSSLRERRR